MGRHQTEHEYGNCINQRQVRGRFDLAPGSAASIEFDKAELCGTFPKENERNWTPYECAVWMELLWSCLTIVDIDLAIGVGDGQAQLLERVAVVLTPQAFS